MLNALVEDSRKSEKQLASARTTTTRLSAEITELNEQLKELSTKLSIKKAAFRTAETTQHELSNRLIHNEIRKNGLCVR